jgi:antitoxin CptB
MHVSSPPQVSNVDAARLRWRCRRGMLELDVVLERYLAHRYPVASPSERRAFEDLLALPDPELLGFVMGWDAPTDPDLLHVVQHFVSPDA